MTTRPPRRGDVYWVNLDPVVGTEIRKTRGGSLERPRAERAYPAASRSPATERPAGATPAEGGRATPAVIVSNDSCNRYGTRVVVLPATSNVESVYPGEAIVDIAGRPSRVLGDQVRSLDKSRLGACLGRLTAAEMSEVNAALAITLGL